MQYCVHYTLFLTTTVSSDGFSSNGMLFSAKLILLAAESMFAFFLCKCEISFVYELEPSILKIQYIN